MNTSPTVNEAFAQRLLDRCPNLLYVYDIGSQSNVYSNREIAVTLGYTPDEILAMGSQLFVSLLHPEDLPQIVANIERIMAAEDGETIAIEYRMRHKNGAWRWLVSRDTVFARDADGKVTQYCGIVDDITEKRNALAWAQRALAMNPMLVYVYDVTTQQNVYANGQLGTILGYTAEELVAFGPTLLAKLMHPDDLEAINASQNQVMQASDEEIIPVAYRMRHKNGAWVWLQDHVRVFLRAADGTVQQYLGAVQDITQQQHETEERTALQEQVIAAQQLALRDLSTPVIPVSDDVLVMPLIGSIDSLRAEMVMDTLLTGVVQSRATTVILDITGVPVVDTQVAGALLRVAQSVKLLGAQVVLTGIRPEVAQTLVTLGVDLRGIITRSTLQSGIAYALPKGSKGDS